ncbi:MAG: nitroreductase family protein, partial [Nitrospira sp.]|nr:nitroreductase family protein [Nitrospira sp.]
MDQQGHVQSPIHELLARRWSPRAFDDRSVDSDVLRVLFEAARWAPSSNNEQPWRFVVATKDQEADWTR